MTTGAVLVKDAMAKRFILSPNQDPDTDQEAFGLRWLNRMMAQKGVQAGNIYHISEETFNLSDGVASYSTTLLASGRPVAINYLFTRLSSVDYPCRLIDNQTWADITYKPVNAVPTVCYYDPSFPNGTLNFYPRPNSTYECHVFAARPLTTAIAADTDVLLPDGYEAAIVDALACYYPYEVPATADMKRDAKNGWDILTRANYVPLISKVAINRGYSVNNDWPYSGF